MKHALRISLFSVLFSVIAATVALAQSNPIPLLNEPLRPAAMLPGGSGFTLTVTGSNFVSGATVNWNGSPRTTTFVSNSKLTAAITSADVAHAGTALVTVVNPPPGGYASNVAFLPIHQKFVAGAFARRDTVLTSSGSAPVVGDFNRDGKLDVATLTYNLGSSILEVFLGNGDGTFQSPITSTSSLTGATLDGVGDFNNDGILDLVAGDIYGDYFTYFGYGDGKFTEASTQWGGWPGGNVYADLNRDGYLDVVNEGSEEGASGTEVELGNGGGQFATKESLPITNQTTGFCAVADFNHDGKLDVACPGGEFFGNGVMVALGNGAGGFGTPTTYATPAVGFTVVAGDVNRDGILDLVTDAGWVLLGNGDGTFNVPSGATLAPVAFPRLVDINADGKLDVVGSQYDAVANGVNAVAVVLGNGDGTFQPPVLAEACWSCQQPIGFGDFNGDGKLDAVTFAQDLITQKPIMSVLLATDLAVSQTIVSYGNVKVGSSSTQVSVLTNVGNYTVALGSIGITGLAPSFTVTSTCGVSLAPGASCSVNLTFAPQKTGSLTATVHINYGGTIGSPQYIELAGTGN